MFPRIWDFWGVKQVNQVNHDVSVDFGFLGGEAGEPGES